eukprot:CAMPEP_0176084964 /NCGR_PEP_ID=MMETSP0120_2-20121206/42521_1 /TAXON_ID=160619 /ORGANISM="Kryptoperidinium foliaceum, Strain CCMP 1326" /LENGTH=249 /DNA_ID=CAMNT_0017418775 /DNA_START=137 /DNA_END=883 /DNA_ORIENTATION=+
MVTQFEDFSGTGVDNLFNDEAIDSHEVEDEEKLIEDGKAQVLKNFEDRKKLGDYAKSQTTRTKKVLSLNMNNVDWSGFSGAAHKNTKSPSGEGKAPRRPSGDGGAILASTAELDRRRNQPKKTQSLHARRSRRHLISTGAIPSSSQNEEGNNGKKKQGSAAGNPPPTSQRKSRSDRRSSESRKNGTTRASSQSADRTRARTRRSQSDVAQRKSLSPSAAINARNRHSSCSPKAQIRRTVSIAAAASSTT